MMLTPYFSQRMSRDHFQLISKFLHFNNNTQCPPDNEDKLFKVWPIIDSLVTQFKSMYIPHQQISIDEGTLRWI
jgi:hypothetical protein